MSRKRYALPSAVAFVVLVLDLLTKAWVQATIAYHETIPVIPGFFNLVHTLNKGAAFGFLNRNDIQWQTWFFIGASVLAVLLVFYLLWNLEDDEPFILWGLGLILGGALGNLVDRVRLGMVVDFLDVYLDAYHWPAFNVADIGISLGSMALIVSFYRTHRIKRRSGV